MQVKCARTLEEMAVRNKVRSEGCQVQGGFWLAGRCGEPPARPPPPSWPPPPPCSSWPRTCLPAPRGRGRAGADGWGSGEQCPPGNCHLTIPILRSYDNDRLVGNQHPDRPLGKFRGYASATTSPHTSGQCVAYFCGGDHSAKKIIRGAAHRRFLAGKALTRALN